MPKSNRGPIVARLGHLIETDPNRARSNQQNQPPLRMQQLSRDPEIPSDLSGNHRGMLSHLIGQEAARGP